MNTAVTASVLLQAFQKGSGVTLVEKDELTDVHTLSLSGEKDRVKDAKKNLTFL